MLYLHFTSRNCKMRAMKVSQVIPHLFVDDLSKYNNDKSGKIEFKNRC